MRHRQVGIACNSACLLTWWKLDEFRSLVAGFVTLPAKDALKKAMALALSHAELCPLPSEPAAETKAASQPASSSTVAATATPGSPAALGASRSGPTPSTPASAASASGSALSTPAVAVRSASASAGAGAGAGAGSASSGAGSSSAAGSESGASSSAKTPASALLGAPGLGESHARLVCLWAHRSALFAMQSASNPLPRL